MDDLKTYLANTLLNKRVHFVCDCIIGMDIVGVVRDWSIDQNEIVWTVSTDKDKIIKIGENHPNMKIEVL